MKYTSILVPVSGLAVNDEAIRLACELARKEKAKILAVHVIEVERGAALDAEQSAPIQRAEKILEHAQLAAKSAGGSIETDLLQSRAAGPALVDEAIERNIDLVIVGVPYRERLGNFQLGATATFLLKNAAGWVYLCREAAPGEKNSAGKKN
ncbi:MAG: universal stress protein [Chloroflexi bacterium]|nr:universal stress protein [Chloroflexota bacterium]